MYPPARAGDYVWVPVTDHPRQVHRYTYENQPHQFATEAEAQVLCDAWNSYGGVSACGDDLPWYPEWMQVLPRQPARGVPAQGQGAPRLPGF